MSDDQTNMWVSEVRGDASKSGAVVATTRIRAGDLTDEHVGRRIGFHHDGAQVNVAGEILRVEHHGGPPPSVSVWFRYEALVEGMASLDDYMRVAPYFEVQLVEAITF